jgi:hypothetical protein
LDESVSFIRVAANELNQFRVMTADTQAFLNGLNKPAGGPNNVFGALENNTIASEDGSNDRRPGVMQSYTTAHQKRGE